MNTEKIIIIEGIDRTGKESVRREITKQTNGKTLVIIRAFISQIAYSRIYNRNIDEQYFFDKAKQFDNLGVTTVYLEASKDEIAKRILETCETHITEDQIDYHKKVFDDVAWEMEDMGITVYYFDSKSGTPAEIAKTICQWKT